MKEEKIFELMADIDEKYVVEARTKTKKKKLPVWIKWVAVAACLCLVLVGALGINNHFKSSDIVNNSVPRDSEVISSNSSIGNSEVITDDSSVSEPQNSAIAGTGLYIPAVELPDTTVDVELDMRGLVVYNGGIYTQAENYYGAEALKIDNLIGKYLGYATGSINEWSTQEEYSEEFASSVAGKVYEVIGYDTDFRVCIREEFEDENGEKQLWIQFLDRLNGITLTTGADLFETRLHIRNRIANIQWQSHNDWNYNGGNIQNATIDTDLWEEFLDQIDQSAFIYTWNDDNMLSNSASTNKSIYDTSKQAHILLTMEDGTVIRLRLIEGGYVGYDALGWYFVQIPGEIFDAIFTACGGNA